VLRSTGNPGEYKVVVDSGMLTVPPLSANAGSDGEVVTYPMADVAVERGDILRFYGQGVPVDSGAGVHTVSHAAPELPLALDSTIAIGSADYPKTDASRTCSFSADVVDLSGDNDVVAGGIAKICAAPRALGIHVSRRTPRYRAREPGMFDERPVIRSCSSPRSTLPAATPARR
jgi:hypothetical protein